MPDKNFIQVAGNTRTDYFDVQRQTRKDGLPIMLPMRNKVLPVLLAAGMLATMPATTAVNVLADVTDTQTAEDVVGDTVKEKTTTLSWSDWDAVNETVLLNVTYGGDSFVIRSKDNNPDNQSDKARFVLHIDTVKPFNCDTDGTVKMWAAINEKESTESVDDLVVYSQNGTKLADKTIAKNINLTKADGTTSTTLADVIKDYMKQHDSDGNTTAPNTAYSVKSDTQTITVKGQHAFNYENASWTFTKTGTDANGAPTWTATATVTCDKHNPAYQKTFDATVSVQKETQEMPNCTSKKSAEYIAYFTGDDGVTYYFYNNNTTSTSFANASGASASNKTTLKYDYNIGHEWKENGDFVWPVAEKYADDYLTTAASTGVYTDHYVAMYSDGTFGGMDEFDNQKNVKDSDWKTTANAKRTGTYDLSGNYTKISPHNLNVYVPVKCTSANHDKDVDGADAFNIPAYVVEHYTKATCTGDASVTYYAYVFANEDEAKAVDKKFSISESTTDNNYSALEFYRRYQTDNLGNGFGSFTDSKTDTWENTATGHTYDLVDWKWDADKSEVTMRLKCKADDKYLTAQSTSVKKNADGKTATVTYIAKDARQKLIDDDKNAWYGNGKDYKGYYLDQNLNPYGQAITVTVPLSDAKGVAMYRLYKPSTGEHFYTADTHEVAVLVASREWNNEGIGWYAPSASNTPVYRVYNSKTGEHVFTKDANEKKTLVAAGWNDEGIAFYSDDAQGVAVYRQFDPNAATPVASHNFTKDAHENTVLTTQYGWKAEGIAWYGLAE